MGSVRVSTIVGGPRRQGGGDVSLLESLLIASPLRRGRSLRRFAQIGLDLETEAVRLGLSVDTLLKDHPLAPLPTSHLSSASTGRVTIRLATNDARSTLAQHLLALDPLARSARLRHLANWGATLTMAACHARMPESAFLNQIVEEKISLSSPGTPGLAGRSGKPQKAEMIESAKTAEIVQRPEPPPTSALPFASASTSDAMDLSALSGMVAMVSCPP